MQVVQAGLDKSPRVGVDEQYINFKPSPNFQNMKRFLKKKIVDTVTIHPSKEVNCKELVLQNTETCQNIEGVRITERVNTDIAKSLQSKETVHKFDKRNSEAICSETVRNTATVHNAETVRNTVAVCKAETVKNAVPKTTITVRNTKELQSTEVVWRTAAARKAEPNVSAPIIETKPLAQPPLPLGPPPPYTPITINIKTEKEDLPDADEYSESNTANNQVFENYKNEREGPAEKKNKKTMCKDYVRGQCTRPVCIFAHEIDVSQLKGVYTFCWNYQNKGCQMPNCTYVHASVQEQEDFYRSGVLPSHALTHVGKASGPPEEPQNGSIPAEFKIIPPPVYDPSFTAVASSVPSAVCDAGLVKDKNIQSTYVQANVSVAKRLWSEVDDSSFPIRSSSPREPDQSELLPKKCQTCETMELRLQYYKEKMEKMIKSNDDRSKEIAKLNQKHARLMLVLNKFWNPKSINQCNASFSEFPCLSTGVEKEKVIGQLDIFMSKCSANDNNNVEDKNKNSFGGIMGFLTSLSKLHHGQLLSSRGE